MHLRDPCPVTGDADELHESLLAGLDERSDRTVWRVCDFPLLRLDEIVQLDEIDVIDAEPLQRQFQLGAGGVASARIGLRGEEELVTVICEERLQPQFRVAIRRRRVDVVDTRLQHDVQYFVCLLLAHSAERGGAEQHSGAEMTGTTEELLRQHQPTVPQPDGRETSQRRTTRNRPGEPTVATMRAAVYYETGGPDVFRYEEVAEPTVRSGGVVIEVGAVSIQGGDLLHRQSGVLATSPHIVGYQAAGTIVAVGDGVTDLAVGQRVVAVMGNGSHAEFAGVPAGSAYAIPDSMSITQAAGIPIEFGTADDCLFEFGKLRAGESVLIQAGAGGVGLAAIQLARAAGASVIVATASSDERLERLREYGMDHGINYSKADVASEVLRLTDRRGVDLVVDPVGGHVLEGSIASLAYRGRVSWVGRAGREERPPVVWPLMEKNASITGVFLGAEFAANPVRTRKMVEGLISRVARGELQVVIDSEFALSEAAAAHRHIESRQAFGRVLLRP